MLQASDGLRDADEKRDASRTRKRKMFDARWVKRDRIGERPESEAEGQRRSRWGRNAKKAREKRNAAIAKKEGGMPER